MHAATLLSFLIALPLSQAANLLTNGNFSSGTWGRWTLQPGGPNGSISVVSPGYDTKYAGAHDISTTDGSLVINYPTIKKLTKGVQYRWSVDYKLNNPGCTTEFANTEGTLILLGQMGVPVKNATWASYEGTFFAMQGNESLMIATFCNAQHVHLPTAEFDNFVLEPVNDKIYNSSSPATGANLVTQPNFGSGTLKAYNISNTANATTTVVTPGYNGAKYAMKLVESNPGALAAYSIITQNLSGVHKDTVYRVSMAIRPVHTEPVLSYIEAYIQQTGFSGSSDVSSTVPYQLAFEFPPPYQAVPTVGKWQVYEGLVSGISNEFEFALTVACLSGTAMYEIGDLSLVPLS